MVNDRSLLKDGLCLGLSSTRISSRVRNKVRASKELETGLGFTWYQAQGLISH